MNSLEKEKDKDKNNINNNQNVANAVYIKKIKKITL